MGSEGEMSDLTPCNASPSLSQLLSWTGCRRLERNDVEESWRSHVQTLMTASSQANLLHTFALFGRLFRDLRSKTVGLTEDSCAFLVRDGSSFSHQLRGAVAQFETLLADLTAILDAYCKHMADSREGIFVMTVSSVDLGQVCSSLMDISLQLLASVKKLEQSLTQRQPESPSSPSRVESAL